MKNQEHHKDNFSVFMNYVASGEPNLMNTQGIPWFSIFMNFHWSGIASNPTVVHQTWIMYTIKKQINPKNREYNKQKLKT